MISEDLVKKVNWSRKFKSAIIWILPLIVGLGSVIYQMNKERNEYTEKYVKVSLEKFEQTQKLEDNIRTYQSLTEIQGSVIALMDSLIRLQSNSPNKVVHLKLLQDSINRTINSRDFQAAMLSVQILQPSFKVYTHNNY